MKITVSNANNQTFLEAALEGREQLSPGEMGLLDAGTVEGLLQPFVQPGGGLVLKYNISPFVSLDRYLSGITEQGQFVALVRNCISVFREMERQGLCINRIVEIFDCIFLYPADRSVYFVYLPVPEFGGRFSVPQFFLGLIDRVQGNSLLAAEFAAQYRAFLQRPAAFTLKEFGDFVQAIHEAKPEVRPPQPPLEPEAPPEAAHTPAAPAAEPAPQPRPADREPVWVTVPQQQPNPSVLCSDGSPLAPPPPVRRGELIRLKTGERFPVAHTPFIIGRDAARADLVMGDNPTVGRVHATVTKRDGAFFLTDNGSLNKSYLAGVPLEPEREYPLSDGVRVRLSDEELMFRLFIES